jgi:hypothetical protein
MAVIAPADVSNCERTGVAAIRECASRLFVGLGRSPLSTSCDPYKSLRSDHELNRTVRTLFEEKTISMSFFTLPRFPQNFLFEPFLSFERGHRPSPRNELIIPPDLPLVAFVDKV